MFWKMNKREEVFPASLLFFQKIEENLYREE